MLEVFFCAAALALREKAEHELDLAVEGSELLRDLGDDLVFELLAVDKLMHSLCEQVLALSLLKAHNVDADLELAHFCAGLGGLDRKEMMRGASCGQAIERDLADTDHVIVLLLALVKCHACDGSIVIEQNHIKGLRVEVIHCLCIHQDFVRVGIVELWVQAYRVGGVAIVEGIKLVEEEGRHV